MKRNLLLIIFCISFYTLPLYPKATSPIRMLILSGSNNHKWQETTPVLESMFTRSGLFQVNITNQPDTLKSTDLEKFDIVLSNWNSWPKNDLRWPEETEKAILGFIYNGGGFVTFHASTSAFYKWDDFGKISTAAWIPDTTWHKKRSATKVMIEDIRHPITKGLSDFYVFDELWVNASENRNFKVLGTASNAELKKMNLESQPAVFVSKYGKGNIFHTTLGHDARTLRNSGVGSLLLRGAEWAATGKVTQPVMQELKRTGKSKPRYKWEQTDTTLALLNRGKIIWQYNFRTKHGRPFFHPVSAGRNIITCLSPDDHPWHLGEWFCWKYINKVNYWEYKKNTFQSEGITEIKTVEIEKNPDHSAVITLWIDYLPLDGEVVLSEKRIIKISSPRVHNRLEIKYDYEFKAIADEVELGRTPIAGQSGGVPWGGYAGLSIRFNQDFMDSRFITQWEENDNINGQTGDWLYMGFTGTDGRQAGSQIMISPESKRDGAAWYSVNNPNLPFYYFSPAILYFKHILLKKGETLHLKYKVLHMEGEVTRDSLEAEFRKYAN